ncbi:NAD(P)-dependent dehydrogenase, short-chain alcohol dehydrogenase family [Pseudonocardia thermophila]|uniref:NAD(P)-dependent dehydrogenase, short-chain alcohol dehydrogenase family n=1 Tax=Pseudonocardia thermophila TaxID=1848 RepID=A0A1M6XKA1_PSETH|nr:SDR family oxidoreductase [Pseudonocardia thermophila]SHL06343.1 NAD(P)-dependent dehydrogenase, short-chain alcohol dehydrogenase family [Pseudonocardia thermophila]
MTTTVVRDRFVGKSVIVTGAASGIGRETARRFAREGARVTVADIDERGGAETVALIEAEGGTARFAATDVTDPDAVQAMVDGAVAAYGRLHVLHNNAYWAPLGRSVVDTSMQEWDRAIATTLTSVFLGCKAAIPHMVEAGGGTIVNTASTSGLAATPTFAAYIAAKGGVVALTRSVAFDFGRQGIRCNAVAPGLIKGTAATEPVFADPERLAFLNSKLVMGRPGEPTDIANAVLFLASDESAFMTGQTMVVDGGRLIS